MTFCGEASSWSKVALTLSVVALALHIAGYATNYWMAKSTVRDLENNSIGLWKATNCSGYYKAPCHVIDIPSSFNTVLLKATKGLESCALIFLLVTSVMLTCYVGAKRARSRGMAIAIFVVCMFAVTMSAAGVGVWCANLPDYYTPNWSFGLTVIALMIAIIVAILLIPDIREYDYNRKLKIAKPPPPEPVPEPPMPRLVKKPLIPSNPMAAPRYDYVRSPR